MDGWDRFIVPAGGGRSVLVRPGHEGECVQLALLSTRRNIIEAVTFDGAQVPGLVTALHSAKELADRDLIGALSRRQVEAERRHADALASNPWLNGQNGRLHRETYIGRRST